MERTDSELVHSIQAGDREAMDLLVRRWYPRVYGYLYRRLGHGQDACDLTQDVFIAVLQNISRYRPWTRFESWLFTIAHNRCMDWFRMRRQDRYLLSDPDGSAPSFEASVLTSAAVQDALARLPDVQREAIELHYFQQLTAQEIAEKTKTPLPTVKSRLRTARKTLEKLLKEDF